MRKLFLFLLALLCACGSAPDLDFPEPDTLWSDAGSVEQPIQDSNRYGWRFEDGWDHRQCAGAATETCLVKTPALPNGAGNPGDHQIYYQPGLFSGLPASYSEISARVNSEEAFEPPSRGGLITGSPISIFDLAQPNNANLQVLDDETISGTVTSVNPPVSSFVHISCFAFTPLSETLPGVYGRCTDVRASVDVGSFFLWVEGHSGLTDAQRRGYLQQLVTHVIGVSLGIGATGSANNAMSMFFGVTPQTTLLGGDACKIRGLVLTSPNTYANTGVTCF